jgi:hypothetical protein
MSGDHRRHPAAARARREDGSITIALLAMIVATGIMVSVSTYAFSAHRLVRFDRERARAIHGADAGVEEVIYRLALPSTDAQHLSGSTTQGWQNLGTAADPQLYRYDVTAMSGGIYTVNSFSRTTATAPTRHVRAILRGRRPFGIAAFADTNITLRGGNRADSYNATTWSTGGGVIGSNGTVTLNGSVALDGVQLHDTRAKPPAGRCTSSGNTLCASPALFEPALDLSSPAALSFVTDAMASVCPASPTAYTSSTDPLLAGGVYCFSTMRVNSNVNFTGTSPDPTIIYLTGSSGQPTLAVDGKMRLNCPDCTGTGGPRPESRRLQIYTPSAGDVRVGQTVHMAGVFYAPRASCRGNPSNAQANVYGALVCGAISNQGTWQFHHDQRLSDTGVGGTDISRWAEGNG